MPYFQVHLASLHCWPYHGSRYQFLFIQTPPDVRCNKGRHLRSIWNRTAGIDCQDILQRREEDTKGEECRGSKSTDDRRTEDCQLPKTTIDTRQCTELRQLGIYWRVQKRCVDKDQGYDHELRWVALFTAFIAGVISEDFLKAGYIKRSTDTGPKKIHEVHEDVRKEEERNRIDRLAVNSRVDLTIFQLI